ncbi:MAG: hypothetical protein M0Z50_09795 [Planctomycetia bacterium]|nr:hypothetical protein [Planctomycetia bacterium]
MGTLSEYRKSQIREGARLFRAKQEAKGLRQIVLWLTNAQARAVRAWVKRGGDVAELSAKEEDR